MARCLWLPAVALAMLLAVARAEAQPPQPLLSCVFPAGGQRGPHAGGHRHRVNLQGADGVRISKAGVTAKVLEATKPDTVRGFRSPSP